MFSLKLKKKAPTFSFRNKVSMNLSESIESLQERFIENSNTLERFSQHKYGANHRLDIDIDQQISALIDIQEEILTAAATTTIKSRKDFEMLKLLWEKALYLEKEKPDLTDKLIVSLFKQV